MYGLGIRVGFYLQWYGAILASWLAPSEAVSLRVVNTLFISASFIALIIQRDGLQVIEIYIVLLLFFGSALYILPILLWRLLTCCNPLFDPTRFPLVKPPGKLFDFLYSLLIMAVLSFMLWFWTVRVPTLEGQLCERNGFIFTRIHLENYGFRVFHLVLCALLLAAVVVLAVLRFLNADDEDDGRLLPESLR